MTAHVWDWSQIVSPDLVERALSHEAGPKAAQPRNEPDKARRDESSEKGGLTRAIAAA